MDIVRRHALPVAVGAALMLAFALGYAQREHELDRMQVEYEQLLEQRDADLQAQAIFQDEKPCKTVAETRPLVYYAAGVCSCDCSDPAGASRRGRSGEPLR